MGPVPDLLLRDVLSECPSALFEAAWIGGVCTVCLPAWARESGTCGGILVLGGDFEALGAARDKNYF